jgi:glucose-6-phosphate isomerase
MVHSATTRITIDYSLAMADNVGAQGGVSEQELAQLEAQHARALPAVLARVDAGELGFLTLADDSSIVAQVREVRATLHPDSREVLVLGIGGSSLGARALCEALCPPQLIPGTRERPRLHFPDNSDPWVLSHLLAALDPRSTAVLVISKSGGTVETAAQLLVVREWLRAAVGEDGSRTRIVAITDPERGSLRAQARAQHWLSLPVPSNIGGRFSALTGVGLLPACFGGADLDGLQAGARAMARRCSTPSLRENPAGMLAALGYGHDVLRGHHVHVMMPYADRLRAFAAWYVQLWAESLGKRLDRKGQRVERGPTPIPAVGATDQHAQVQLFMEGPRNKLVTFIRLGQHERDLTIPRADGPEAYLAGATLGQLLDAEQLATSEALAMDGRPSLTVQVERLDASAVGGLIMLFEMATALAGEHYGVDAFDQPGVELGKRLAFGLLGREGYAETAAELRARQTARSDRYRIA